MAACTVLGDVKGRHALVTVAGPGCVLVTRRQGQAGLGMTVCPSEAEAQAFVQEWLSQRVKLVG